MKGRVMLEKNVKQRVKKKCKRGKLHRRGEKLRALWSKLIKRLAIERKNLLSKTWGKEGLLR